jgi:peptidoglycan/LPS O-acetylase OafA/YrhL
LYLWHWPLLVFSKAFFPEGSSSIFANTFFIVFLTFVLTIATYFIAEDRIRKIKGRKIVVVLLVLMLILGITTLNLKKEEDPDWGWD